MPYIAGKSLIFRHMEGCRNRDLVVMSMETYEELLSTNQIDKAICEAEREVAEGAELLDAREALGELRRKHLG